MDQAKRPNGKEREFDGRRFRTLQLERAKSSLPIDNKEDRRPDAFRRWSSMNESGLNEDASASPWGSANTTPLGASYASASSSRPKYRDEPVVYVLPDPEKNTAKNVLSKASNARFPNQKYPGEEEEVPKWDLKYPHGMPRWGPRLVTPNSLLTTPPEMTATASNTTTIDADESNYVEHETYNTPVADTEAKRKSISAKAKKQAKQSAVVEKAKTQSLLAAARAVQNINSASPGSLPKLVPKRIGNGLGSRFLRCGPQKSLLQSARIKQAHVMQANVDICQARSLDDPLCQPQQQQQHGSGQKVGARSVQSFEFLQRQSPPHNNSTNEPTGVIQVETVRSDSEEDADESLSIDDSASDVSSETSDTQLGAVSSESHSWSMRSSSTDDAEELSIDETIVNSAGHQAGYLESEDDSLSRQPPTPLSYSVPTMILSEVDPAESTSRHSDYSSLELHAGGKDTDQGVEVEDEFFDAIDSLRFSQGGRFDAKRCRELLKIRNQYLEQEERKKLLSPQAESRLFSAPPLRRGADETTLLELATRSKWMDRTQADVQLAPTSSPFSAAYPVRQFRHEPALASMPDEGPNIQPISLVAPSTISQQVITRKEPWHVGNLVVPQDDDANDEAKLESHCISPNTATPFKIKLRCFLLRCLYLVLFLLWATRVCLLLRDSFTTEGATFLEPDFIEANVGVEPFQEIPLAADLPGANASRLQLQRRTTRFAWTDMPILLLDPTAIKPSPPLKCPANLTKRKFWQNMRLNVKAAEEDEIVVLPVDTSEVKLLLPLPKDMFIVDMLQAQSFCDEVFHVCYNTPEVVHLELESEIHQKIDIHLEAFDENFDINMNFLSTLDDSKPKKPLLKSIGEMLRKHGQQLQEKRRMHRERFSV